MIPSHKKWPLDIYHSYGYGTSTFFSGGQIVEVNGQCQYPIADMQPQNRESTVKSEVMLATLMFLTPLSLGQLRLMAESRGDSTEQMDGFRN